MFRRWNQWPPLRCNIISGHSLILVKSVGPARIHLMNVSSNKGGNTYRSNADTPTLSTSRDTSERNAGGNAEQTPEQQASEGYHHDEPVRQRGRNLAVGFRRKRRADQMR